MPFVKLKFSGFLIALAFAALTFAGWAVLNRPTSEPPWPERIQGFAFSPFATGQDPREQILPSESEIDGDLKLLSGKTNAVRTYSVLGSLGAVPKLADKHDINVAIGAWLDSNRSLNEKELTAAIELARTHMNVVRVFIGNEVVLRGDLPKEEFYTYLDRARAVIGQPVSTAEPWHVWLKNPEMVDHVDFIAVHLLPYWEGVPVEAAVDYSMSRLKELEEAFPGKPIMVGEVGWPSNGRTREGAVASTSNEALFLRRFLSLAEKEGYIYYVMEAFDQPWKAQFEGAVGAYWGVYDVNRRPKFEFRAPIVRVPNWQILATTSVAVAFLILALLYVNSTTLRKRGRSFLAIVVFPTATVTVWIFYQFTQQYLTATSIAVGVLLFLGMLGVIAVLLAEAHEWAEAHWVVARRRLAKTQRGDDVVLPKVSIHVPAYNEPPEMVIETLNALARLDYPNFEVIMIDNNTRDEAVWRPVEAHCATLGPRFRFFHVEPLEGFKAGALNFSLRETAEDVEVIAVIDSDYMVEPNWLRDLAPTFNGPNVGIVQAPQDYRDATQNAFKAMAYAEYRGFFLIGMVTRNDRNAIIQHGTMTMVRRSLLDKTGGWAEWCITEDAELGLRVFEAGYEAVYTPRSYGKGLMPDTFIDFKKQRFRWAYGAMQIMKRHAGSLFSGGAGPLTAGQRYHFVAGWLPWIADGFNVLFNLAALGWSVAMVLWPERFDPPLAMFSVLPLSLFTFKLLKLVHLYRVRVGAGIRQTLAAAIAGLALAHTIGVAIVKGTLTRNEPFFRTPKHAKTQGIGLAFAAAREETLMMIALWLAAWGVANSPQMASPDRLAWVIVMVIQSLPYLSTLLTSIASAFPLPARMIGDKYPDFVEEGAISSSAS